jgi:site-specific recombinase XerD
VTTLLHKIVESSPNLADVTRRKYLKDLDEWERYAGKEPSGWTRAKAQAFYRFLTEEKGLKPQSANRLMSSVRYAAKWWATDEGKPDLNFTVIRMAKPKLKNQRQSLSAEQAMALLEACRTGGKFQGPAELRDFVMIVVGLETGMRRMSLGGMMLSGFEAKHGYPAIKVPIKGHGDDLYPVPLSDTAKHALDCWVTWLKGQRVTSGYVFRRLTKRLATKGLVWDVGDSISERAIHQILVDRGQQAGLRTMHPHLLRHTFITWREMESIPEAHIAAMTGHIIAGLGEFGGYIDRAALGAKIRNTTPPWLADYVRKVL